MAKALPADYVFPERVSFAGKQPKYPWKDWLGKPGTGVILTQGEPPEGDFTCAIGGIRSMLLKYARRDRKIIQFDVRGNELAVKVLRFMTPEEVKAAEKREAEDKAAKEVNNEKTNKKQQAQRLRAKLDQLEAEIGEEVEA